MSYTWVLFDADGTLFDYDHAEQAALEALSSASGLATDQDLLATYRRINSELWKGLENGRVTSDEIKVERFRRLAVELGFETDPARLSADYLALLARQTRLLDGAERVLARLAGSRRLALITNGLAEVQRPRLRRSPIGHHFEHIVISEEVGFAKPDARIFEAALARMGSPPKEDVLMVGDNLLADILGAQGFGLATCWLNLGGHAARDGVEPTYEIHDLTQLTTLFEE